MCVRMENVLFTGYQVGCLPKTACHSLIRLQDTKVGGKELRDRVLTRRERKEGEYGEEQFTVCGVLERASLEVRKLFIFLDSGSPTFCVAYEFTEILQSCFHVRRGRLNLPQGFCIPFLENFISICSSGLTLIH